MQLWAGASESFIRETTHNQITERLIEAFFRHFRYQPSTGETNAWRNSLRAVSLVFQEAQLKDHGVLLEYQLPLSSRRLDCMVCGLDSRGTPQAVIIELKQWDKCNEASGENLVTTMLGGSQCEILHPSAQVSQYRLYLEDTHTAFYKEPNPVKLAACAYLHNYTCSQDDVLFAPKFTNLLATSPTFTADDVDLLKSYLVTRLERGSGLDVLQRIQQSRFRPSKKLMNHVAEMIEGQPIYVLLDEQLVVFDSVLASARRGVHDRRKHVMIIRGGPGTGKSVIALNLMSRLLREGINVFHATGSRAFTSTLRTIIGKRAESQFKYYRDFALTAYSEIDVIICDEAHRLRKTSTTRYSSKQQRTGLPQIEEIVRASQLSVFFIDDKQVVRPDEIGSTPYIRDQAKRLGCSVSEYQLEAQFRCAGSDGFVNWVNNTLGIARTANVIWDTNEEFDFRIFDSPKELDDAVRMQAERGNTARLTAGFCWPWSNPKPDGTLVPDVQIDDFSRPWNAKPDAKKLAAGIPKALHWAHDPKGVDQIGCVYTAQGFEFDYVGVIFGPDLRYSFDKQAWEGYREASYDSMVKRNKERFTDLVKNAYRVLLSRGLKGCYVFFMDKDTERFVKSRMEQSTYNIQDDNDHPDKILSKHNHQATSEPIRRLSPAEVRPFVNCVPLYELKVAAGLFSETQTVDEVGLGGASHYQDTITWVALPEIYRPQPGMFVAQVIGESMNRRIPNGSWCLFRRIAAGTRNGKIVLAQHRDISDPDTGGQFTVKLYESEKEQLSDGTWCHKRIILKPDSTESCYGPIILSELKARDVVLIAEFLALLE
ncbi:MAG TPA: DUF2075 domain-containing protein [Acidobacteriota bacterium]|nr:DUF2075 domain-containing protein [Acidobacteriota bacterium]HQG92974.1 DUF2075 domain-containing protein [Acidobacteriota bacterium]HQK86523.1 DUF2075 domain-containing protein [Acidobacteriota bacterium]